MGPNHLMKKTMSDRVILGSSSAQANGTISTSLHTHCVGDEVHLVPLVVHLHKPMVLIPLRSIHNVYETKWT